MDAGPILATIVGSWIFLTIGFFAYSKAVELQARGVTFTWWVNIPLKVGFVVGYVADVIFNATWGSVIFREIPREWTFSQRVNRWIRQKPNDATAVEWAERINKIMPGHIG